MTRRIFTTSFKEASVIKRILAVSAVAVVFAAIAAAPAFAEGYNNPTQYTRATGFFSGPHGGYTTTTNKCNDCHSTHYAEGSYKLLRASSREAACDYCHGGGGGSTINIQMDNQYRTGSFDKTQASAISSDSLGFGTGHTLGYTGNAPTDIKPAFSDPDGFACFDCHTPHGNSARVMTTMSNPGHAFVAPGQNRPTTTDLNASTAFWPIKPGFGSGDQDGLLENGEWGIDNEYGNFVWDGNGATAGMVFRYRPIWPTGRWLLLKNAHTDVAETKTDTTVAGFDETATAGVNKYAVNWVEPLGPADSTYGGGQDNDNDNAFPFAPKQTVDTDGNGELDGGFLSVSEFCTDCHDGTAGASTQAAEVWRSFDNTYAVAFAHDAQPRH